MASKKNHNNQFGVNQYLQSMEAVHYVSDKYQQMSILSIVF